MILSYIKYYFQSKAVTKVKNDFIRELNSNVFSRLDENNDADIQALFRVLLNDNSKIEVTDYGAGSRKSKSNERTISSIAKNASVNPKFGKLLSQLIFYSKAGVVIELGTSLGVGTSYLASRNKNSKIYTIEGCPKINELAKANIERLNLDNVTFFNGEFSSQLNDVIKVSGKADFVYIDGNHTYEATLNYFNFFKKNVSKKSIIVFDDIHWSEGMEKAWHEIMKSEEVKISIDLFRIGIVFLDPEMEKNHFVLSF